MFGFSSKGRQVMSNRMSSLHSSARLAAARARRRSPMKHNGQTKSEVIDTGILVTGRSLKLAYVGQMTGNRRRNRHCRAHQMRTAATSLPPLKIAVRCGGTALSRLQPVGVHRETHGTPGLAPLEPRFQENT